jgi:hypothetical protein
MRLHANLPLVLCREVERPNQPGQGGCRGLTLVAPFLRKVLWDEPAEDSRGRVPDRDDFHSPRTRVLAGSRARC